MTTYAPDVRTASDLTSQARAAADVAATTYDLNVFLPSVDNYSLTYNFDVNQIGLVDKAEYRAFDTETRYGRTQGASSRAGSLPPIGRKYKVAEYEQLQLSIGGDMLLGDKLDEYARRAGTAIAARVALAQGQGIEFGAVTLNENGLSVEIDFGRKAEHEVTAATLFSNAAAPIIDPVESWLDVYVMTNGGRPGTAMMSQRILTALTKNEELIATAMGRSEALPSRIGYADVQSVFTDYGLGQIKVYDQAIDGERIISDNKIVFLPSSGTVVLEGGALGTTEWGITAESIQPVYGVSATERPGIFSAAFSQVDPQGVDVLASAVVIPAIKNANATFVATVL